MSQPPPLPNERKARSGWLPILTTLAYPGAGQFLQGRRVVAWVMTGITTLVAVWWLVAMVRGIIVGMNLADPGGTTDLLAPIRYVMPPTKALGVCYLVSFLDAVIARWRMKQRE